MIKWFLSLFKSKKQIALPATPEIPEHIPDASLPDANDAGSFKLGIIVGHEVKAPGALMAAPYKLSEYVFNMEIAKIMMEYAAKRHPYVKTELILRNNIGISGAYRKATQSNCDCVIELHFNAFNGSVAGTETLSTASKEDQEFAHIIHDGICKILKREGKTNRGIKTLSRSDRAGGNVHAFPSGANCIVEPVFGDTPSEAKLIMDNKEAYARGLIDSCILWARKVDLIK